MSRSTLPRSSPHGGNKRATQPSRPGAERRGSEPPRHGSRPKAGASSGTATAVATAVGFAAAASVAGAIAWSSGCRGEPPPGASTDQPSRTATLPAPPPPITAAPAAVADARDAGAATSSDAGAAPPSEKPYTGPLLGATALATSIFPRMEFTKERLGYIRHGGKVPVDPTPVKNSACSQGWYHLVDGGYVCARFASLDMRDPLVKLGITAPNLDDLLPYKYAYNTAHGTPLYKSVPSKEDMIKYEPYLELAKKARRKAKRPEDGDGTDEGGAVPANASNGAGGSQPGPTPTDETASTAGDKLTAAAQAAAIGILDGGAPAPEDPAAEDTRPWWQKQYGKGEVPKVKLEDLETESDSTIAKRMVKGFFVAVDKTFGWNDRLWYKTTAGLVAPADRMYIVKPPASQGLDIPEGVKQVGFILATKAQKYDFDAEKKNVTGAGPVARFTAVGLTGATISNKTIVYRQTTEGWWMKGIDGTITEPGPPPADLAPGEKWIDVNLTKKTLVAFEGDRPVYAALVSPGKKSKIKAKDHSTVQGTFRIREKHIATTMDGDGPAPGDLPYSIEDVPYVAYFQGSYALHGAFWHSNFGHEMSHGCVNLSPLDAKKIFFWTEPKLPRGWHGVWATPQNRGTIVVVHE